MANGSFGFGFGVGYVEKTDMSGPVSYQDFYQSLPFTGANQRQVRTCMSTHCERPHYQQKTCRHGYRADTRYQKRSTLR